MFVPLPEAATLFLPAYRSMRYAAAGLRYSRPLLGKVNWRTEMFVHVNFQPLREGEQQQAARRGGPAGLVYQTPLGPLALHARYIRRPGRRLRRVRPRGLPAVSPLGAGVGMKEGVGDGAPV